MTFKNLRMTLSLFAALLLAACGGSGGNNDQAAKRHTEIVGSEPDEESLTHRQERQQVLSPDLLSKKLELPVRRSSPNDGKKRSRGFLEEIKLALAKLEAYSLRSSEDINESIEQLISCFNSNTTAL